ncbi:MAG: hypothetical protein ACPGSM_22235, partial [Thiolinea sp.]
MKPASNYLRLMPLTFVNACLLLFIFGTQAVIAQEVSGQKAKTPPAIQIAQTQEQEQEQEQENATKAEDTNNQDAITAPKEADSNA